MRDGRHRKMGWVGVGLLVSLFLLASPARVFSQGRNVRTYTIKNGRMYIALSRHIDKAQLDSFIVQYDLSDLDLPRALYSRSPKSFKPLNKMGWRMDIDNNQMVVISKAMIGLGNMNDPAKRMTLTEDHPNSDDLFPSENDNLLFGFNRFVGKFPFAVTDSFVTFYVKGHTRAREVLLAGSFTNWQNQAVRMTSTDSGWIYVIKLHPGKYWYKFIIDGNWTIDRENNLSEDDGRGNTNSVYFKTNAVFTLQGFVSARDAFLAGSFNDWNPGDLPMYRTFNGWQIHLYLAEGTHTYKFIVDGKWVEDPKDGDRLPDGHKGFNSVYRIGKPHLFVLNGYNQAKSVVLAGSFNQWKPYELFMHKTAAGWELPYTIGPGNYEYKFLVDGKWIPDPANPLFVEKKEANTRNSFLIIAPNHTFRLHGFEHAERVYLAGDFNNWTPGALHMKRVGDDWVFNIHLSVGKHLYKFIVDGKWIKDPDDPLWEGNEFGTDNSVIWIEHN